MRQKTIGFAPGLIAPLPPSVGNFGPEEGDPTMFSFLCQPHDVEPTRGGWRQKLSAHAKQAPFALSRIGSGHLIDWADGLSSARQLATHCWRAKQDGVRHPMVDRLAGIAPNPDVTRGVASSLVGLLEEAGIGDCISRVRSQTITHMISPVRVLDTLQLYWPTHFRRLWGIDSDSIDLANFWAHLRTKDPFLAAHPLLTDVVDWSRVIPLTVHEDAGPYSRQGSVNVISFSAMFGTGDEKLAQIPICAHVKKPDTGWAGCAPENAYPPQIHVTLIFRGVTLFFKARGASHRGAGLRPTPAHDKNAGHCVVVLVAAEAPIGRQEPLPDFNLFIRDNWFNQSVVQL